MNFTYFCVILSQCILCFCSDAALTEENMKCIRECILWLFICMWESTKKYIIFFFSICMLLITSRYTSIYLAAKNNRDWTECPDEITVWWSSWAGVTKCRRPPHTAPPPHPWSPPSPAHQGPARSGGPAENSHQTRAGNTAGRQQPLLEMADTG